MNTAATSRLGWYVRRAAQTSPAEMAWRVRDQVVRAAWSPRQVTRHQLARFVEACLAGAAMPIPLESLVATTKATIAVRDSLLSGQPEQV